MGQITTGVGLISGLPIADIIDQLMAIEARPKQLVQKQNAILTSQQTAYQEINAKLLALKLSAASLANATTFKATAATSSNESVLTATSSSGAVPGNYFFTVHRLVAAQQVITSGFADTTSTAVGATTLTFERGEARLDANTLLSDLNGGEGLKRGKIRITDRSGASAVVDLSTAVTVSDVIDAINSTLGISVTASVSGDALILTDNTGLTASNLIVADVGVTGTATSLGLAGSVAADTLTGAQINRVGQNTLLASLNDRNGVQIQQSVANFRITTAGGGSYDIDLTGAATLGDVIDAINTTTGGEVTASIGDDGVSLKLIDTTGGGAGFTVTALNGSSAAADLGILGSDADGDGQIAGGRIVAAMNSKLLKHLNGGAGVATPGTIAITNRSGVATQVDLSAATSVSDVIDLINASGAGVTASLNRAGNGILLTDATGGSGDLVISDVSGT
ncbi:MAG TPA: flagellar cap protein FliD N-terminal domain-containing protein, partial [Phycisphaeraceae bacterium]